MTYVGDIQYDLCWYQYRKYYSYFGHCIILSNVGTGQQSRYLWYFHPCWPLSWQWCMLGPVWSRDIPKLHPRTMFLTPMVYPSHFDLDDPLWQTLPSSLTPLIPLSISSFPPSFFSDRIPCSLASSLPPFLAHFIPLSQTLPLSPDEPLWHTLPPFLHPSVPLSISCFPPSSFSDWLCPSLTHSLTHSLTLSHFPSIVLSLAHLTPSSPSWRHWFSAPLCVMTWQGLQGRWLQWQPIWHLTGISAEAIIFLKSGVWN